MDSEYKSLVNLVPFGGAPEDKAYLNARAEIYLKAKRYIVDHGISGLDEQLREELKATRYIMSNHDRIQLIPKDDIRLILKRSPDSADAFALSFYTDDQPRGLLLERTTRQCQFMG
jgi:3-dehydroquinate dehydratase